MMQNNKSFVYLNCFIIELPRSMRTSSPSVLHKRNQSAYLYPSQKQPFLGFFSSCFVPSDVKAKIQVTIRSTMNHINHGMLETINIIVLIANPSHEHYVFWRVFHEGPALQTIDWSWHDQAFWVLCQCVVVEGAIVLICILMVSYVPLLGSWVRPGSELINKWIRAITLPSVNSHIDNSIHKWGKPLFSFRVEKINKSTLPMPPLDSFPIIQKIFLTRFLEFLTILVHYWRSPLNHKRRTTITLIPWAWKSLINCSILGKNCRLT